MINSLKNAAIKANDKNDPFDNSGEEFMALCAPITILKLLSALEFAMEVIKRECFCEKLHPDTGGKCGFCYELQKLNELVEMK